MCPGTLAITAAAMAAAGDIGAGVAKGDAANYQAQVASNNRTISEQNAGEAAAASSVRTELAGRKARSQLAGLRTGIAANGLDVNTGSAADVQTSQREIGAFDTATTAHEGALAVYGYKTQAANFQAEANLKRAEANNDYIGGVVKAGSDLLGNSTVDSKLSSLMSGNPSAPAAYKWMTSPTEGDYDTTEAFA